jgi:tRNA 2-(methylsulfanyl)-N6-isopentenyladenosine37 hydroxylase
MLCLKRLTDDAWAAEAMGDLDGMLVDHAHCEMKAASNALSLAARHPADFELLRALTGLAREEIEHFQRVLAVLEARGVPLGPPAVDEYAAHLRRAATALPRLQEPNPLLDRLLVGAIIEARSCERFKLLAEATARSGGPSELHELWSDLLAREAQHYRTFVDLAVRSARFERARTIARLDHLAELEASIVGALPRRAQSTRATVHG